MKTYALVLAAILAFSCILMVESTSGQPVPNPPNFTLKYVDNSYDVPATSASATDPYTGKTVTTTTPGYHVENKSIELTITNQPFTPYSESEGNLIKLFYNVRYKGHFGNELDWINPFYVPVRNGIYGFTKQNPQSNSEYTLISVPSEFRVGDVIDFQVQTMEGFHTPWEPLPVPSGTSQFTGTASDWSSTQTITIPADSVSPSPTVPEFSWLTTLPLLILILSFVVLIRKRKWANGNCHGNDKKE
jgi:hypothetical protein